MRCAGSLLILTLTMLFSGCASTTSFSYADIDYSGKDGCQPFNIGHRLGGDLPGNTDNSLQAMIAVAPLQDQPCFKYWEFDVGQTEDSLMLWHDLRIGETLLMNLSSDRLPGYAPSLQQFEDSFHWLRVIRPVVIDLKLITDQRRWPRLRQLARNIRDQHDVPVWFITETAFVEVYTDLCDMLKGEFDIRLYGGKGDFCEVVKAYHGLKEKQSSKDT
ncbi:hypothetical protein [Amphritea sp. HPY]|uniref:hypothetical protein n=1 Tax=Amphritea sp. HPY TaxID=3421652 RepID=UPI003D7DDBAB